AVLEGEPVGPFPTLFQRLSSGFIPDMFNGETLRISTVVVGVVVAFALFVVKLRERASHVRHGMEEEPGAFFLAKQIVFAAVIIWFCWLLASYKGLPNVLV